MNPFSYLMAHHCGPVLLGKKPAALFSVAHNEAGREELAALARQSGLAFLFLQKRKRRALVFLYRPALLAQALNLPVAKRMLRKMGYPADLGLENMLAHLEERLCSSAGFPHEIGFFLGYPPADVVGFILYNGKRCKHSCMWKVYGDVEKAVKLCDEFRAFSHKCCRYVETGGDLLALPEAIRPAV